MGLPPAEGSSQEGPVSAPWGLARSPAELGGATFQVMRNRDDEFLHLKPVYCKDLWCKTEWEPQGPRTSGPALASGY